MLVCNEYENANTTWMKMTNCIKRASKIVFYESKDIAPLRRNGSEMKIFILLVKLSDKIILTWRDVVTW